MAKRVSGIKVEGLDELQRALGGLPDELNASIIRNVARKPANKVVSQARKLFTYKDTGVTKRTFGILKVKNRMQKYLEIGVKGRSLAYIYQFFKGGDRKTKDGANRGTIKPLGNVVQEAAANLANTVTKEMSIDISKVIGRYWKRKLRR